jgi:di/tricarboxylate transporter
MLIVFGILAGAIGLFVWGRPRADIVALLVALALMLSHVLTPGESLAGFGDPVVILMAAVFIVGEALVDTGAVQRLGEGIMKAGGASETRLIALIMLLAALVGAFMSSTAVVAMFIPVVLTICNRTGLNRKRLLMPLSVATLISGMMTLIASSPNMIVENTLRARGLPALGFFSWTPFGLAVLAASMAFMLLGRPLLSKEIRAGEAVTKAPSAYDLVKSYGLADRWHRWRVPADSPLIHRAVAQMRDLYDRFGLVLVGFERHRHGKTQFLPAPLERTFEVDDAIFVVVPEEHTQQLLETQRLVALPALDVRHRAQVLQDIGVAEVMVAPESKWIGRPLGELELRARYHVSVLAARHRGEPLTTHLGAQRLDFGDTLLVAGEWNDLTRMWEDRQYFVALTLPAEYHERLPAHRRLPIAVAVLVGMIAVMAFGLMPNAAAALLAALAMVATGCIRVDAIYRVISWKTVVLTAGLLPLSTALTRVGATELMAHGLVSALGTLGPVGMLAVVFLVTAVVGLFISNAATAVLVAPVALEAAQ